MKKSLLILLSFILILSIFAGCSSKNNETDEPKVEPEKTEPKESAGNDSKPEVKLPENFNLEGFPIVNDQITLTLMGAKNPNHVAWEEMYFFKKMEEISNIKLNFNTPPKGGYEEKKNLTLAGGDYPDLFFGGRLTNADVISYGTQEIFIPLEDLIENYAPNIKKYLEENPEVLRSITAPDGHIYALPTVNEEIRATIPLAWVNGDWLKNLNITEMPKTVDGLYDMLKRFKEEDPNQNNKADEIPMSVFRPSEIRHWMLNNFGHVQDFNDPAGMEVNDGKVSYIFIQEGYKEYLSFLEKLYSENLLDHGIFSHTASEYKAKGTENLYGVFPGADPRNVLRFNDPDIKEYSQTLPPLTSKTNDKLLITKRKPIVNGTFAITNINKYPEATMRWLDHIWSEEGEWFARFGEEGTHYKKLDNGKWEITAPEGMPLGKFRGTVTPEAGIDIPMVKRRGASDTQKGIEFMNEAAYALEPYAKEPYPVLYFTTEEQKRLSTLMADINTYLEQSESKFIVGDTSLDKWDDYVSTMKQMKIDEAVEIYQQAYDRWNK